MIDQIKKLYKEKELEYSEQLQDEYLYYITNISNRVMAASLRCCVFLVCIYEVLQPKRVLDLGSGFSSYSLRYFKNEFSSDAEIYSIDSSEEWVEKSREFCQRYNVDDNNFYHWSEIKDKKIPFELIFMDIDFSKKRVNYYDHVCKQFLGDNTFMLVDDMHKPILRNKVKTLKPRHIKHNILSETKDRKRFSWLLEFGGK